MPAQHVESEQNVHLLVLEYGEAGGHEHRVDLHLHQLDAADDLLRADAARDAREAAVDEAVHVALLGAVHRHDGALGARVDERLHMMTVDIHVDISVERSA